MGNPVPVREVQISSPTARTKTRPMLAPSDRVSLRDRFSETLYPFSAVARGPSTQTTRRGTDLTKQLVRRRASVKVLFYAAVITRGEYRTRTMVAVLSVLAVRSRRPPATAKSHATHWIVMLVYCVNVCHCCYMC